MSAKANATNINCFAYIDGKCRILNKEYTFRGQKRINNNACKNCNFFKTQAEFEEGKKIFENSYPQLKTKRGRRKNS